MGVGCTWPQADSDSCKLTELLGDRAASLLKNGFDRVCQPGICRCEEGKGLPNRTSPPCSPYPAGSHAASAETWQRHKLCAMNHIGH